MAIPPDLRVRLQAGTAIPALPLALDAHRCFDPRHQRAVVRYYLDAGVGGIAVGVHSTQFAIRDAQIGLYEPLLAFTADEFHRWSAQTGRKVLQIAGVCGKTPQAITEAGIAVKHGYHAALLSLVAMGDATEDALIDHVKAVGEILPIIGFYLQENVGGRPLSMAFWRRFAEIPAVVAIKIAPFNRYKTIDVVRAVSESGRANEIALYTGNDDTIVADLLTTFDFGVDRPQLHMVGGLLGHWGVWTKRAVELHTQLAMLRAKAEAIPPQIFTLMAQVTDMNAAVFDAANGFRGCIPGIHEILHRNGLLAGTWCLDPNEILSPGQAQELDRVSNAYPHLTDDAWIAANITRWLAD